MWDLWGPYQVPGRCNRSEPSYNLVLEYGVGWDNLSLGNKKEKFFDLGIHHVHVWLQNLHDGGTAL